MTGYGTREHAAEVADELEKLYPQAECALEYEGEDWKLLVMARLSAQCTDKRVNEVCKRLFEKYRSPYMLAKGELSDVEDIIRPCGLYHVKARDIIGEAVLLTEEYDGRLPDSMEELLRFPGVGRKVANLLLGDLFGKPAVVVDTHCIRLSERLGLVPENTKDPYAIEKMLSAVLPPEKQSDFCHRIVTFGREYCPARGQKCDGCPLARLCRYHSAHGNQKKRRTTVC